MRKLINLGLMVSGILVSTLAFAQKPAVVADSKPGWHRIGGLQADFKKQNESIHIMGNDEFTALKLKIVDAAIHIERMQIFYESGDMENIDVKSEMTAGESSGALQLKYAGRDISKIAFTYHSVGNDNSKKSEIEIYGLKTGSDSYNKDVDKAADKVEKDAEKAGDKVEHKAEHAKNDVERAAEKTGDAVSETASKAAAEIDDKRLDGKVGPDGQVIYVGDDSRYYYINNEGNKVFITEVELKDKD
jgi:hypothetical protein